METTEAFARGIANRGKPLMVFDWDKAAKLIKESGAKHASAGLDGDWEWTGGDILVNGVIPTDHYCYLASTWAVPQLSMGGEPEPCFKMQEDTDNWDAATFWPDSAKKIMGFK